MKTSCEVHFAVQQMSKILPGYSSTLTTNEIAQYLHITREALLPHLDILLDMCFIDFTNLKHEEIMLTFTGKFAQIDEFAKTPSSLQIA